MKFSACIFDLDETLVDWSSVNYHWGEAFTGSFVDHHSKTLHTHFATVDWARLSHELLQFLVAEYTRALDYELPVSYDSLFPLFFANNEFFIEFSEQHPPIAGAFASYVVENQNRIFCQGLRPYSEAEPLLKFLQNKKIKVGALSNAINSCRRDELEAYGLLQYFNCVHTAANIGYPKPVKEAFLKVLDSLQIPRTDVGSTLFVGDRIIDDGVGSLRAGMHFAYVQISGRVDAGLNDFEKFGIEVFEHPHFIGSFTSLSDLQAHLSTF